MKKMVALMFPVVLLAGCGGSSTSDTTVVDTTTPSNVETVQKFTLMVGENSGPDEVFNVPTGSQVELTIVNPDADDEVHLHGYDLSTGDMTKGEPAVLAFTADTAGDFEVESHVTEDVLLVIEVV